MGMQWWVYCIKMRGEVLVEYLESIVTNLSEPFYGLFFRYGKQQTSSATSYFEQEDSALCSGQVAQKVL